MRFACAASCAPGIWLRPDSTVPEPSSLALVLAGIGAVGYITRRRRSKLG
jgi:hypothetical protein